MNRLSPVNLANPRIPCADCKTPSHAAARHPKHLCLLCEAKTRKRQGK